MGDLLASKYGGANDYLAEYDSTTSPFITSLCNPAYSNGFHSKHRSKGYVSLLILLLLTTFSGFGMEVYLKANAENRMVKRETQSRQALYIAEGGIEWAKAHLLVNPGLRKGDISLDTGRASIVIQLSGGGYEVISEGRSGLAIRKIQQTIQLEDGKWVMKSYQELHY